MSMSKTEIEERSEQLEAEMKKLQYKIHYEMWQINSYEKQMELKKMMEEFQDKFNEYIDLQRLYQKVVYHVKDVPF